MKNLFPIQKRLLPLTFILCLFSFTSMAQEVFFLDTPTVGYDTTITLVMKVKTQKRLNTIMGAVVPTNWSGGNIKVLDYQQLNDTLLSVRIYTGTTEEPGLKSVILYFYGESYTSTNTFRLAGTKLFLYGTYIRRGIPTTYELSASSEKEYPLTLDSITEAYVLDSSNNPASHFTLDSITILNNNTISVKITDSGAQKYGIFKLKFKSVRNGTMTYSFEIRAPRMSSISQPRGFKFTKSVFDSSNNVLFKKGAPNTIRVFKNNQLTNAIIIDSVKSTSENNLVLYGAVPATTPFGTYTLEITNTYDTLTALFKVPQPVISLMNRIITRNTISTINATTTNAKLNIGTTTLSLANPADSVYLQLTNLQILGANSFTFTCKTNAYAKSGSYYLKLYNSADSITIIDSLFIPKGSVNFKGSLPKVFSESKHTIELTGTNTLFTKEKPVVTIKPSVKGSVKVDSIYAQNDNTLKIWFTTDPMAEGTLSFETTSTLDGVFKLGQQISIIRPYAKIGNTYNYLSRNFYDSVQVFIQGTYTHFKRVKNPQLYHFNYYNEVEYYDNVLRIDTPVVESDTLMSLWIYSRHDGIYPARDFMLSVTDTVSGELKLFGSIILTDPIVAIPAREKIWKQSHDTLLLILDCFQEDQLTGFDTVMFQDYQTQAKIPGMNISSTSYQVVNGNPCMLIDFTMDQTVKSGPMLFVVYWKGNFVYMNTMFVQKPVFLNSSSELDSIADSTFNFVYVFEHLHESATTFRLYNPEVQLVRLEVRGDSVFAAIHYNRFGTFNFTIETPVEGIIHDGYLTIPYNVGMHETQAPVSATLFPNPAQDQLNIQLNETYTIQQITVTDLAGKVYINQTTPSQKRQTLNIDLLKAGLYLVMVKTNTGEYVHSKFMKK